MFTFFFRLASLVLSESLAMVFAWNSSPLQGAVHQPVAFHNFKLFSSSALSSLLNYGFISDAISFICTCAFKQSWNVNITQYHESVSGRLWSLWCSQSHWASSRVLQRYFIIAQIHYLLTKSVTNETFHLPTLCQSIGCWGNMNYSSDQMSMTFTSWQQVVLLSTCNSHHV